jgi:hypothetical protein
MPLQFRRGHSDDLPHPSDAAVGEPLFTTNDGKLRIKKANGDYAVIGSGTAASGDLDLSNIAIGAMVKVNSDQDGFDQAAGSDLPSHSHPISAIANLQTTLDNKAFATHTHTADAITGGQIPSAVTFATADGTGFANAVEARLLDELPTDGGVLDIAQQSTLVELGDEIDTIAAAVAALEAAPDGVDLTGFSDGDVLMVEAGSGGNTLAAAVAGTDYIAPGDITRLRAVFAEADLPATAGTTTGYLKWTYADGDGSWSVVETVATVPSEINGGNASSFGE